MPYLTSATFVEALGAVYECGCADISEGNCDCDGNQFDALGECGGSCLEDADADGICDNVDDCVGALDALGECGGSCLEDADADGICDNVDDCVGALDACDICNGPGPTNPIIENVQVIYDSVYAVDIGEWVAFVTSIDTTFSYACEFACGGQLNYQGYDYWTVQIGEQCWFAENLRAENYRNGDAIPSNLDNGEWSGTSSGATAIYGEGTGTCDTSPYGPVCDEQWSLEAFGRLYNGYAVTHDGLLCPVGWHVPTDDDWKLLETALGMNEAEVDNTGWRGSNEGLMLKGLFSWIDGGSGQDDFGFTALAAGARTDATGNFTSAGFEGSLD